MKTIIIGAGEVGHSIAHYLVQEGHPVVMVDEDAEALARIGEHLDIQTICGRGSHPDILMAADAQHADMLIAVTPHDEVNMVACQMAYTLYEVPKKIARVRDASYLRLMDTRVYSQHHMPVDVIISPELEVAEAIARALAVPGAFEVFQFPGTGVMLVGIGADVDAPQPLRTWPEHLPFPIAIERRGRLILPTQADHIEDGDAVFVLMIETDIPGVLSQLGHDAQPLQHIMILGGGNVGFNLAKRLEHDGKNLRLIEYDEVRAEVLAEKLNHTVVLHGDGLDRALLIHENIAKMDAVLCVTANDSVNLLGTVQAQQFHVPHVYTLLHEVNSLPLADHMDLDKVISPREITASRILQHVRRGHVRAVHALADGAGEVIALDVPAHSPLLGQLLGKLKLPTGSHLALVVRQRLLEGGYVERHAEIFRPGQHDAEAVQQGDILLIVALTKAIQAVEHLCS